MPIASFEISIQTEETPEQLLIESMNDMKDVNENLKEELDDLQEKFDALETSRAEIEEAFREEMYDGIRSDIYDRMQEGSISFEAMEKVIALLRDTRNTKNTKKFIIGYAEDLIHLTEEGADEKWLNIRL